MSIASRLAAALLVALAARAAAQPPPIEAFFRHADYDRAELSPSGRWLAISAGSGGTRVGLFALDLTEKEEPRQVARFSDADVLDFSWTSDERLVLQVVDRESGSGDQRFAQGLFSVRSDGSDLRMLIRVRRDFLIERRFGRDPLDWNHGLLFVPSNGKDEVVVGQYHFRQGELQQVLPLRLNVATQQVTSLAVGAPENSTVWMFDHDGEPRLAGSTKEGRTTFHWRAPGKSEWASIAEFPTLHAPFVPRFMDPAGTLYVVVAAGAGAYSELRRFDFASRRAHSEPVVRTPGFDFHGEPVLNDDNTRVLGIRIRTDGDATHWFDPQMKRVQQVVDTKLPGRINRLSCKRCGSDEMVVLVDSWSDQDPGTLWIYRPASDKWQRIMRARKDIDPRQMALMDFYRYPARDGRQIPVWITQLMRAATDAPRPAVVLVHGGPWVREGVLRWRDMAQFLASRGYVVIEPEFRGSRGYGRAHYEAGWKQWGRAMQDDLADAVKWAVDKGVADPKRVCIAGASYGGYATLMGLIRHPDVYRCGVAWAAVTDPRLLFKWSWRSDVIEEARLFRLPQLIGDPEKDAALLAEVAPVEHAARIKAPLLLAFGGEDRRVPIEHGTRIRDALRAAGRDPEWVLYSDEGHGWMKLETRIDSWRRVERFLGEHLN